MKILLVEDDPTLGEAVMLAVRQAGFAVDWSRDGVQAETALKTYAYDAMHVLIAAMKRADSSDPAKYLAELPKTDYQGVTGHIRFDAKGDLAGGAVTLYQVKNGKWQTLETVQSGK
ncbi:MAG: ABC transporter substrate-binding protein [Thiobacillus sp.]|nr:ABC transporter substrate-binding protein [Thiobacillus sp.]